MANESSSSNPWFGVSMALIGVVVGYGIAMATNAAPAAPAAPAVVADNGAPAAPSAPVEATDVPPVTERDYVRGDRDATISVIEYSDFECPFCVRHHPTMVSMMETVDDVNWVYRHFPLAFHPSAQKAAEASECVGELGGNDKFWEYSDLLFSGGSDIALLADKAESIGIDRGEFQTCLDSGKFAQYISDQMQAGSASGVNGTPGNIVINNKTGKSQVVSGAQPLASFTAAIDALK